MNELKLLRTACCLISLVLHVEFVASASARRESHTLTLTVDPGTVVNINRTSADGPKCTVCVVEAGQSCQPEAVLTNPGPVSVTFGCSAPWEIFTVEIVKKLECKKEPCQHTVTAKVSDSLLRFNRTLHWCLRAPVRMTFHVAFGKLGLAQIQPRHTCPDEHTYDLVALETTKNVHLGSYCANGTVTGVQILNGGKVVLTVPGGKKMEPRVFDVYWGEDIKTLAVVNVKLPRGQSSQEFFSANYPSSFPDDDLMTWNFSVPRHHDSTVKFLDYSVPHCRKKVPEVGYERGGERRVLMLSQPQLTGERDPFEFTLRNCEMDIKRSRADDRGLTLHFRVSAIRTGSEVLCPVDFTKEDSLTLHVAKTASDSTCKLKQEGVIKDSLTLLPGKKSTLSFKDCAEENLLVTVNKTITFRDTLLPAFAACEYENLANCPTRPVPLTVPALERCLPESLRTIHWNLQAPEDGTVELWAFSGTLRQSLPGQECNGSVEFRVAEGDGTEIGEFCTSGTISEIQINSNVTVTATPRNDPFLSETFQTFFKVSFTKDIRETYIFWVNLKKNAPSRLLASPGWPAGMKPDATASWITQVPAKTDAEMILTKVTQPKCQDGHTIMQVQTKESQESLYSRREDEEGESEITVHQSFYLNMSNCQPETGHFSAMWETKLARQKRLLLPIILGVVGALLLGTIIALVVVCVVVRKKKQEMAEDAAQRGVYNPNGHMFLPGLHGPPKTVEDDEDAHIYDYIEDTLVYGHLLQDNDDNTDRYGEPIAMDTYKPSNGNSETTPLKEKEANGDGGGEAEVGVYRPFVPLSEGITTTTTTTQEDKKLNTGQSEEVLGGGEGRRSPEPLSPCSEALQVQQVPVDV